MSFLLESRNMIIRILKLPKEATIFSMFYIYVCLILLHSVCPHYPQLLMNLNVWKSFQRIDFLYGLMECY